MQLGTRAVNVSGTVIDNGLDSVGLEALVDLAGVVPEIPNFFQPGIHATPRLAL